MILEDLALYADCAKCKGLCCRALYFSRLDGFPQDKPAGVSCRNLCSDYTCRIHHELKQKGMKGCLGYDCLGAGQLAVQKKAPSDSDLFTVYVTLFSLHQMLWYLGEALQMKETTIFHGELQTLLQTLDAVRRQPWDKVLSTDIDALHNETNRLLKKTIQRKQLQVPSFGAQLIGKRLANKRLRNTDFSMKPLLATDLSCCDLQGSCFLGSDLRDCSIAGSDLRGCFFLTQMQLNTAQGDSKTKLPAHLHRPSHWDKVSKNRKS